MVYLFPATALLLAALGSPAQESASELSWSPKAGDRFRLKWSCTLETISQRPALKKGDQPRKEVKSDIRTVEAEAVCTQGGKERFAVSVVPTSVAWKKTTPYYTIDLKYRKGIEPVVDVSVSDNTSAATFRQRGEEEAGRMRELMKAPYTIHAGMTFGDADGMNPGVTVWNGSASGASVVSLFNLVYLHSATPKGQTRRGQKWKEGGQLFGVGIFGFKVDEIEMKVTSLGSKSITVKGAASKSATKKSVFGNTVVEKSSLKREYSFSPEGHLLSSSQEARHTKDDRGSQGFGPESSATVFKQSFSMKKE